MKSFANLLVLILVGCGFISFFVEVAILINRPFAYIMGAGLSVFVILAAFEIYEKARG